jgi:Cu/Ag efflux pump CusA
VGIAGDDEPRATALTTRLSRTGAHDARLLPAALSTRIGAQTQRPLAVVVIGGALAIALLTRVLQPALVYLCHRRLRLADRQGGARGATKPDV